jgi:hypothetical protein
MLSYPDEAEVDNDAEVTADTVEEKLTAEDDEEEVYADAQTAGVRIEDVKCVQTRFIS